MCGKDCFISNPQNGSVFIFFRRRFISPSFHSNLFKKKFHNEKWNIFGRFFLNLQINLSIIALVTSGHVAGYQGQLSYHPSPLFPDRWIFLILPENTICPCPHLAWIPYLRQDDEHVEMLLSRLNVSHIVVSV